MKHTDGQFEYVPYFCLPANDLNDVIAPSCYSCFDCESNRGNGYRSGLKQAALVCYSCVDCQIIQQVVRMDSEA